jgi:uncharacterized protein YerC
MRRYKFLTKDSVHEALNKLRAAFLAAKDGEQVEEIIKGVLTTDEQMKIGRRIQIAEMLNNGITYREIKEELKVGITTILLVDSKLQQNKVWFDLIMNREEKVKREYKQKSYRLVGGSTKIFKSREYTGFKRKNVVR